METKYTVRMVSDEEAAIRRKLLVNTRKEASVRELHFMGEFDPQPLDVLLVELNVERKELEEELKILTKKRKEMVENQKKVKN